MTLTPEEAIQRHSEGDRSPEVLAALTTGAFQAFHDPWESHLKERSMSEDIVHFQPDTPLEAWKEDPQAVLPVTLDRLAHWAGVTKGWSIYRMEDPARVMVRYRYSPSRDRAPDLSLSIEGKRKNIVRFSLRSNTRVEPKDFVKALRLANWWNQGYRWPAAVLYQDYRWDHDEKERPTEEELLAFEDTKSSELRLEQNLFLPEGIHQAGLEAWLTDVLATSWDFWEIAHKDWGL